MAAGASVARSRPPEGQTNGMKLIATVNGRERTLELPANGDGNRATSFLVDALPISADIEEVEPGVFSVLVGARSVEAKLEQGEGGYAVTIDGRRFEVSVRDPRRRGRHSGDLASEGPQAIKSPMPGKVVRLLVKAGDPVTAGAGLFVIEAMKMQNEIRSPKDGIVSQVRVQQGASVSAGETMAVVE